MTASSATGSIAPARKSANTKTTYPNSVETTALPSVCLQQDVLTALRVSQPTLWRLAREHDIYRADRPAGRGQRPVWSRRRVELMALVLLGHLSPDEAMTLYRRGVRAEIDRLSTARG